MINKLGRVLISGRRFRRQTPMSSPTSCFSRDTRLFQNACFTSLEPLLFGLGQTFVIATSFCLFCTSRVLIEQNSSKWQRDLSSRFILKLWLVYWFSWLNSVNFRSRNAESGRTIVHSRFGSNLNNIVL